MFICKGTQNLTRQIRAFYFHSFWERDQSPLSQSFLIPPLKKKQTLAGKDKSPQQRRFIFSDFLSVTISHLPRRLQDVFKVSPIRVSKKSSKDILKMFPHDVFFKGLLLCKNLLKTSCKAKKRCIEDVFNIPRRPLHQDLLRQESFKTIYILYLKHWKTRVTTVIPESNGLPPKLAFPICPASSLLVNLMLIFFIYLILICTMLRIATDIF